MVPKVSVPRFHKPYGLSLKRSRRSVTLGMPFNVRVTCTWILPHFLAISCVCSISFGSWKRSMRGELEMTGMKVRSVGGRQFSPRPPDPVPVSTRKQQRASATATINHTSAVWAYYDSHGLGYLQHDLDKITMLLHSTTAGARSSSGPYNEWSIYYLRPSITNSHGQDFRNQFLCSSMTIEKSKWGKN